VLAFHVKYDPVRTIAVHFPNRMQIAVDEVGDQICIETAFRARTKAKVIPRPIDFRS
jgi:hypothetical protein